MQHNLKQQEDIRPSDNHTAFPYEGLVFFFLSLSVTMLICRRLMIVEPECLQQKNNDPGEYNMSTNRDYNSSNGGRGV